MTDKNEVRQNNAANKLITGLFWTCTFVVAAVPLAFSTTVYRIFVLPKLAVLLVGAVLRSSV